MSESTWNKLFGIIYGFMAGVETNVDSPGAPVEEQMEDWILEFSESNYDVLIQFLPDNSPWSEIEGKRGTAERAFELLKDIGASADLNIIGLSAGADALLMLASIYGDVLGIDRIVVLGPSISGGVTGNPNYSYNDGTGLETRKVLEDVLQDILNNGIEVLLVTDSSNHTDCEVKNGCYDFEVLEVYDNTYETFTWWDYPGTHPALQKDKNLIRDVRNWMQN